MKYVLAALFDDYISANVSKGLLESENINCWLRDENIVAVEPGMTYAVGGIKLMVAEVHLERALGILKTAGKEFTHPNSCIKCGSANIEYIATPRKASGLIASIANALLPAGSPGKETVCRCSDCGYEYDSE